MKYLPSKILPRCGTLSAVDLRSDTVTKNRLQKEAAERMGKEAALFVPSGSMGNQIAINIHTNPGEEVILDSESHIFNYEMGAMSSFSGVLPRPIRTGKRFLPTSKVKEEVRSGEYYYSKTGLIAIENTNNRRGGTVYPEGKKESLVEFSENRSIPIHLDGARIFNASIASGKPVDELAEGADSVMFCLSKGLGAPVGSMIVGSEGFIEEALRVRKTFGGGMRQVGILAAAGLYALENHIGRLEEDHKNAQVLADSLEDLDEVDVNKPETNIVMVTLDENSMNGKNFVRELKEKDVLAGTMGPRKVRLVTHLDINEEDIEKSAEVIKSIF